MEQVTAEQEVILLKNKFRKISQ